MENLNPDENENTLGQNEKQKEEQNLNGGSQASDGPVKQTGTGEKPNLADLNEQTRGGDADKDESLNDDGDLDEQLEGSDSDYDNGSTIDTDLQGSERDNSDDDEDEDTNLDDDDEQGEETNNHG